MSKLRQEALLPGTDAIKKGDIEMGPYRGRILVRYKDLDGFSHHHLTDDPEDAHEKLLEYCADLRLGVKRLRTTPPRGSA